MLRVENLEVRYGAITAVRNINMTLEKGEMVAVLGANGAGKTTTMLAIAGAIRASAGRITFGGETISGLPPERIVRSGITLVPESREIFPDLTVLENLRLGGFIHRAKRHTVTVDMERVMELFPILRERENQAAGTLSGGEQQQLAIARGLMTRPQLMLLDEPSLGLAPTIVDQIFELIMSLKETGLSILLVEQNVTKALECSDRAYVMSLGEVAASGSAQEIADASDLEAIYLGSRIH